MVTKSGLRRLCLPVLIALAVPAAAEEGARTAARSAFDVSGFATLGLSHSDNGEAGVITSSTQKRPMGAGLSGALDSVLGLQLGWQPLGGTAVVVQGVARASNDFKGELRMAHLRQSVGNHFAVRVGRIRSPLYFDSDVSEIGYAYLTMRPPIALYGMMNSVASIDGVDVQWRDAVGNAAVMVQGYYGHSDYRHRFYNLRPAEWADARLRDIRGVAVSVAMPDLLVRASRTWIGSYTMSAGQVDRLNAGITQLAQGLQGLAHNPMLPAGVGAALQQRAAGMGAYLDIFDNRPTYTSIGFDGNVGDWRFLGEYTAMNSGSDMVGRYRGYQLTAGYAFGNFTPYVSIARQRRTSDLLDTAAFAPTGLSPELDAGLGQVRAGLDEAARHADLSMSSVSVGVRYDFREGMALKVQYDHLKTPDSMTSGYFAVSRLPFDNRVNLFTVALDMTF